MRLPLAIPLDARDGLTDQDGRMTNVVAEVYEDKTFVLPRPGLSLEADREGAANGVFCFDGQIITVWGTTIETYYTAPISAYDSGTSYSFGDLVIYVGTVWLSLRGNNQGNTPSFGGGYWTTEIGETTWDELTIYDVGDSTIFDGVTYYSLVGNNLNVNKRPNERPSFWTTTPVGTDRYSSAGWVGGTPTASCEAYVRGNYGDDPDANVVSAAYPGNCSFTSSDGSGPYTTPIYKIA